MRKYAAKLLLLLFLSLGLQIAYEYTRGNLEDDLKKFRAALANGDIVYFCDSTNARIAPSDSDLRSTSQLLDELLATHTVSNVDRGAYHALVYEDYVDAFVRYGRKTGRKPATFIVPINLRSFSAEWDLRPNYQFEEHRLCIRWARVPAFLLRAVRIALDAFHFRTVQCITPKEFEASPVYFGTEQVGCVRDYENPEYAASPTEQRKANKVVFYYLYALRSDHRKLVALKNLARKAEEADIPVVFYITPIDFQTGERYFGTDFTQQVESNIAVIHRELAAENVPIVNLAFTLSTEAFNFDHYTNEHLTEFGRRFVASQLTKTVNSVLGTMDNEYDPAPRTPQGVAAAPGESRTR